MEKSYNTEVKEQISKILDLNPVEEETLTQFSDYELSMEDVRGTTTIELESTDQLEEDLEQLDETENILTHEERELIIKTSFLGALEFCKDYIDPRTIQTLFPNIDIQQMHKYDFKGAKLKIKIINKDSWEIIKKDLFLGENAGGKHYTVIRKQEEKETNKPYIKLRLSHKDLCIIKESGVVENRKNNQEIDKEALKEELRHICTHEILHELRIGEIEGINVNIMESIVEWYALLVNNDFSNQEIHQPKYIGYKREVTALAILLNKLDLDGELINKAFISKDLQSIKSFEETFIEKFGELNYRKFIHFKFKTSGEYLEFIQNL